MLLFSYLFLLLSLLLIFNNFIFMKILTFNLFYKTIIVVTVIDFRNPWFAPSQSCSIYTGCLFPNRIGIIIIIIITIQL